MANEEHGHPDNHGQIECEICGAILDFESGKTLIPTESNAYELNGLKKQILEQNNQIQKLEKENQGFLEELKNERKAKEVTVPEEESKAEPEKKSGSGLYIN